MGNNGQSNVESSAAAHLRHLFINERDNFDEIYNMVPDFVRDNCPEIVRQMDLARENNNEHDTQTYYVAGNRRLGEENSGTSGYLSYLFIIIIGLMATYLVARVFYRAYKTKRASRVDRAAESFSDACDSVAVQALDN